MGQPQEMNDFLTHVNQGVTSRPAGRWRGDRMQKGGGTLVFRVGKRRVEQLSGCISAIL
jgi:hypothetical protein